MSEPTSHAVEVVLPADAFRNQPWIPSEVAEDLRLLWLIDQVRRHRLSIGQGSEFAGMARAAFMERLGEHGVPVIDYPATDLVEELKALGFP